MPGNVRRRRSAPVLSVGDFLREVVARPELIEGLQLGDLILPEPLRLRGQWIIRSQDLLSFRLELTNLTVVARSGDATSSPVLKVTGPGAAFITLHFAPQSIIERAFFARNKQNPYLTETDGHVDPSQSVKPATPPTPEEPLVPPPVVSRIAYPTRLVFLFSEETLRKAGYWPVAYTLEGILRACSILSPNVAANARDWPRPHWPLFVEGFELGPKSEVLKSFDALGVDQKAAVLVSARRNEWLAARLGSGAGTLLIRRGELPVVGAEAAFDLAVSPPTPQRSVQASAGNAPRSVSPALPLTPAGLALRTTASAVAPTKRPNGLLSRLPRPSKPELTETSIELPFRLVLSPGEGARFAHDLRPAASSATGHTALWHTRLAGKFEADTGQHAPTAQSIRAIWARGGPGSDQARFTDHWSALPLSLAKDGTPFRASLDDRDRYNIVHLSGNFQLAGGWHEPIDCRRLMLSTVGGWLDARGEWRVPAGLSVEQWVHQASQARDHYVRVVYKGYLLPFGHRVSLVKETRRYFTQGQGNTAYLLQRMFIMVREHVRRYPETTLVGKPDDKPMFYHRVFPFAEVRLNTEITPDLSKPEDTKVQFTDPATSAQGNPQMYFWPAIDRNPFRFQYTATDLDGNEVSFELPGIFIDNQYANPLKVAGITGATYYSFGAADWKSDARSACRRAKLHGQKVAFAPSSVPGDTANEVEEIEFGAETDGVEHIESPKMRPTIRSADVRIPAVGALSGGRGTNTLRYEAGYFTQQSGFGAGEVYAKLDPNGQGLDFTSCGNRSGGFVQPNLAPKGLSRKKGPVSGDITQVAAGNFNPSDFFSQLAPLLFGCIPLDKIIAAVAGKAPFGEMPNFVTEALREGEALFNQLGQLDNVDTVIVDLVRSAGEAMVRQAIEVAFADVRKQLAVLDAKTALLEQQVSAVVTTAMTAAANIRNAAAAVFESPVQLQTALQPVISALQSLAAALQSRDTALQVPGVDGLSASTIQIARQQIALAAQRVQQVQSTLADFQRIPAAVTAAKDVMAKVTPVLVEPTQLKTLLDTNAFGPLLTALKGELDTLSTALSPLKLIEGAVKKTLLGVAGTLSEVLNDVSALLPILESLIGEEIVVRLNFAPTLQPFSLPGMPNLFKPHDPKAFSVGVEARVKKSGGSPSVQVRCGLTHFDLNLLGEADAAFIRLEFEKIEFIAEPQGKTRVDVGFSGIHFIGVLTFVESLRDLIPLDGFSDPPGITVDERGIEAQFSVALPNLAIGVMSLSNLSLGAGFTVPFIGQPLAVRFNFCTRESPFNLTVSLFGGGGFFNLTVDPHGVQKLEAAFEFGAAIAIDFGVASGGVHVMAGIYFKMEPSKASLAGYFRLGGYVDVLGLISASIELYMDLTYVFDEGKCIGRATLTIEVHVLFFSCSVSISCERKFAGSSGDPSFIAQMGPRGGALPDATTQYAWRDYCQAFA
jgi:hypothetical protein